MKKDQIQSIPPIEIHDYQQFLTYARRAKIVTFEPIYHSLPIASDAVTNPIRWLKALNIFAIGVNLNDVLVTLIHKIVFPPFYVDEGIGDEVAAESQLNSIVTELETKFQAVPGAPEQPSLHDEWIRTLR
jgi:hypothetical protein